MTPLELRLAAVSYLEPLGNMFVDRLEAKFKGQCVGYIDYMKRQDSWGDDMTLTACSHILRRKIFVVTDSSDENHMIVFCPPDMMWQGPLTLSLVMDKHYDSTERK
jgi:hypothetical protein